MKTATEYAFTGTIGSTSIYDSSKLLLGSRFNRFTGSSPEDNYISTIPIQVTNVVDAGGLASSNVHVYQWSSDIHWIFMASTATAAITRSFTMFMYTVSTNTMTYVGSISAAFVGITGNKTVRGLRALVYTHTTGTVSASGTSVTGSSTQFTSEGIAVGARIGFGTTNPNNVTAWYDISAISSNTALTLSSSAGTIAAGTSYVIEETRLLFTCTSNTPANGGLFLIKGLSPSTFTTVTTSISEAASTDNVRAIYFLKDDTVNTATVAYGVTVDTMSSYSSHNCYLVNADTTTSVRIYKFNLRAALTVSSGISTSAFVIKTGAQAVSGNVATTNNARIFTVNHGVASGIPSLYFCTTTRVYRVAVANIIDASTTFISDSMIENPSGGPGTFALSNAMLQVDYSSQLDRLLISTSALPYRIYITDYRTDGGRFEKTISSYAHRTNNTSTDADAPVVITLPASPSIWTEDGILFISTSVATATLNLIMCAPIIADGLYADTTGQYIVTPSIALSNASKLYKAYVSSSIKNGEGSIAMPSDYFSVEVRTSGISDDSGAWVTLDDSLSLTGISATNEIQFKFKIDMLSVTGIPPKFYSVSVVYEDGSQDYHYEPSLTHSSGLNRRFAWRQAIAWGTDIPDMRIKLYNVSTGFLVLDDTILASASGTWEYSNDGISWSAWDDTEDNVGNYIRYVADSLPTGITVRAILTQV